MRTRYCKVCGRPLSDFIGLSKLAKTCGPDHSQLWRNRTADDQRALVIRAFRTQLDEIRHTIQIAAELTNAGSYALTMVDRHNTLRRWPQIGRRRLKLVGTFTEERNFQLKPFEYPTVKTPGNYDVTFFSVLDPTIEIQSIDINVHIPYGIYSLDEAKPLEHRGDRALPPPVPLNQLLAEEGSEQPRLPPEMEDGLVEVPAKLPEIE